MSSENQINRRVQWRMELVRTILTGNFDPDKVFDLVFAGLDRAKIEGLLDAAMICSSTAAMATDEHTKRIARILCDGILELSCPPKDEGKMVS